MNVRSMALALPATLLVTGAVRAQVPALKTEPPPPAIMLCPVDSGFPASDSTAGAPVASSSSPEQLISAATQALILGDLDSAADRLDRALSADPGSAEANYLRGRVTARRDGAREAAAWFCRYLVLEPTGVSALEARRHLERAADEGAGGALYDAFSEAVELFEAQAYDVADDRLTMLLRARPQAASAWYNRGVVRATAGRPADAAADFGRYLELRPEAEDRAVVEDVLATLAPRAGSGAPGAAFLLGTVFPGGGQYYTRRPGRGLLVTAAVGALVGAGLSFERVTISCSDATARPCPEDRIIGRTTERPYLWPAVGLGAGIGLIAALEAALHARDRRARTPRIETVRIDLRPNAPRLDPSGTAVDLPLVRVHF